MEDPGNEKDKKALTLQDLQKRMQISNDQLQVILENSVGTIPNVVLILSDQAAKLDNSDTTQTIIGPTPIGCSVIMNVVNGKVSQTCSPTTFSQNYLYALYDRHKRKFLRWETQSIDSSGHKDKAEKHQCIDDNSQDKDDNQVTNTDSKET